MKRVRDAVVRVRSGLLRAGRPAARMAVGATAGLQSAFNRDSRQFGPPRYERRDVFEYVRWHGIAGATPIRMLHPSVYHELPEPIHEEPEPHYEIERRRASWTTPGYVFELSGGRAIGGIGAILTEDDHYLAGESYEFHSSRVRDRRIYSRLRLPPMTRVEGRVASLSTYGDDGNLYHWLYNALPRLGLIRASGTPVDAYYVTNASLRMAREALELLEIPTDRVIDGKRIPHLAAETMVGTSVPGQGGYLEPWNIQGLRDLFLPRLGLAGLPRRLLISRAGATQRRLVNEDELWTRLEPHGFERLLMETLSLPDQMRALRDAEAVVGLHGANLSCLAFVAPGTPVVEIFPRNYVVSCYAAVSGLAGARYAYAMGEGEDRRDYADLFRYVGEDATVDVEKVVRLLARASDGRIRL